VTHVSDIGLIVGRELRKNIRSVKGIVLFAIAILGGLGLTMLVVWGSGFVEQKRAQTGIDSSELADMKLRLFIDQYGEEQGRFLAAVPTVMYLLFNVMVGLAPLFIVLMGFDSISGETQYRTVRFWTLRARRSSYYVGKVLGLWVVNAGVWLAMSLVTWIVATARGDASFGECVTWGTRMWLVTLPMSGAWVAIVMFVASLFRRPMISLLVSLATFFGLWVLHLVNSVLYKSGKLSVRPFDYIYPNFWDNYLLTKDLGVFMTGLLPCLGLTAVFLGLGLWRFHARDL